MEYYFAWFIVWLTGFVSGCIGLYAGMERGKIPLPRHLRVPETLFVPMNGGPEEYFRSHRTALVRYLSNSALLTAQGTIEMNADRKIMVLEAVINTLPASHISQVNAMYQDRITDLQLNRDTSQGYTRERIDEDIVLSIPTGRTQRFRRNTPVSVPEAPMNPVAPQPVRERKRRIDLD